MPNHFEKGNMGKVIKDGNNIIKTKPFNGKTIQRFLKHLEGYQLNVPRCICESNDTMTLSFVSGEAIHSEIGEIPLHERIIMIDTSAKLLRRFHQVSQQFEVKEEDAFFLEYHGDLEKDVICHNDFAPYNVTFVDYNATGIIDFDTICPAPREWDIAYALYRYILIDRHSVCQYDEFVELFLKAYGYKKRVDFYSLVVERLQSLVALFDHEIEKANPSFVKMEKEGHKDFYIEEIERLSRIFKDRIR